MKTIIHTTLCYGIALFCFYLLACERDLTLEPTRPNYIQQQRLESSPEDHLRLSASWQDSVSPPSGFHPVQFLIKNHQKQGSLNLFDITYRYRENPSLQGAGILHMEESVCDSIWDAWPLYFKGIDGIGLLPSDLNKNSHGSTTPTQLGVLQMNSPTGKKRTSPFWLDAFIKPGP